MARGSPYGEGVSVIPGSIFASLQTFMYDAKQFEETKQVTPKMTRHWTRPAAKVACWGGLILALTPTLIRVRRARGKTGVHLGDFCQLDR